MVDLNGLQTLESMNQASWYNRWLLKKFATYLAGDILEVGCGIGNFTKELSNYGTVTAIDVNPLYIRLTKKKVKREVSVGFGDIEKGKFFFGIKKFDSIVCLNVLEHIKDDKQAIRNLQQILKPGGKLILLVPAHQLLYGSIDLAIGHFRRYSKSELAKIFKEFRFSIVKLVRLNFLGAIGWFIAGRLMKDQIVKEDKIRVFNFFGRTTLLLEELFEPMIGISILVVAVK